jgi:hypothetical protein
LQGTQNRESSKDAVPSFTQYKQDTHALVLVHEDKIAQVLSTYLPLNKLSEIQENPLNTKSILEERYGFHFKSAVSLLQEGATDIGTFKHNQLIPEKNASEELESELKTTGYYGAIPFGPLTQEMEEIRQKERYGK